MKARSNLHELLKNGYSINIVFDNEQNMFITKLSDKSGNEIYTSKCEQYSSSILFLEFLVEEEKEK